MPTDTPVNGQPVNKAVVPQMEQNIVAAQHIKRAARISDVIVLANTPVVVIRSVLRNVRAVLPGAAGMM